MKPAKGFFLLETIIVFTLSSILLLSSLRTYAECLITLQRKLLLEEAISMAEILLITNDTESLKKEVLNYNLLDSSVANNDLAIKEVQIKNNETILFSLAEAKY